MSINSRGDEEFVKMPPSEEEPLLTRAGQKPRKFILMELYEQKLKPRVRIYLMIVSCLWF